MDRIVVDSQIHFGKPCIAGTRISVQSVLELLTEGLSFTDIIRDYYSDLQPNDIRACLEYAIARPYNKSRTQFKIDSQGVDVSIIVVASASLLL